MANDESVPAAVAYARLGACEAQARVVRHFRQIVLWPIQLIAAAPGSRRESADALFERLSSGNWALVDDEFGIKGDASFGQAGYSVTVEGDRLIVSGSFAWGLLDKAERALAENRQIQIVVLEGPGGHVGVGTRLGNMIKAHGLDTLTTEFCASACTEAFVAGKNRYLREGAKLGFHAVGGDSQNAIEMGKKRSIENMRAAGLTEDFISRSFETPADSLWYPTNDELREANVITEIVE